MIHKGKNYTLYLGNSLDVLDTLPDNSVDSIVTDPPYEIGFMGKGWDNTGIAFNVEIWKKALRVLKPGGHMVAFNHSRMFHRMMVAIEDAGFEIRDTIMWLYGSGFPKSMNIGLAIDKVNGIESKVVGTIKTKDFTKHNGSMMSKENTKSFQTTSTKIDIKEAQNQWSGWGTALKPAYEPIILARKPVQGSIIDNVLKWGVGGINIDGCRVETEDVIEVGRNGRESKALFQQSELKNEQQTFQNNGRFPANLIHDGSDEVISGFPIKDEETLENSPSRFFYTAKASQDDRNEGLDIAGFEARRESDMVKDDGAGGDNPRNRTNKPRLNTHPTVKPTDLMKYLVRLITPKGGVVLDLFMGSGSTGKAVMLENATNQSNYHFIGIDMTKEYVEIAKARIDYAIANPLGEAKVVEVDGEKILDIPISLFE
jgi:DNA modification methylase